MATPNQRDVELKIAASASGTDQVQALAKELQDLAKKGGDAAPEIEKLSSEVTKLGQQTGALRTLEELSLETTKTGVALDQARQKAELLGQVFQEQSAKTQQFREAQAQARAAVEGTEQKLLEARAALNSFKANADNATRATVGYKEELKTLRNSVAELENALAAQKGLVASKSQINEVERELRKASNAYDAATKSVGALEQQLAQQNASVDATKSSLNELGIAARTVEEAQSLVEASAREVTRAISAERAAYEFLAQEARQAAAAEREMAAVNAIEQKRQDAIKLQRAAEYVNFWTEALNKAEAAERQLAEESKRAAAALNQAFATTGIRSAEAIRAEINQIIASLVALKNNANVSGAEFDRAFASAKVRIEALERELRGLPPVLNETTSFVGSLRQGLSQLTAAFGVFELGRGFLDANVRLETLRRSLTLLTGSSETAKAQIEFLKQTADGAGLSYSALAQDFVNFTAAANTSGITLERQREVFGAVANAAGQLGLSTDRVGLILQALSQTASKGKVSLEELQGQLGESLPGALSIVANGLGVTKTQLLELVQSGIDVETFFDAFVRGSRAAFGDGTKQVEGFAAAWNRFKNTLSETATFFGNEGGILAGLVTTLNVVAQTVRGLSGAFEFLGQIVGISAAAIVNFDLTKPIESFKEWGRQVSDAADRIQARLDKANGVIRDSAGNVVDAQTAAAEASVKAGEAAAGSADGFNAAAAAQNGGVDAAKQNAAAQAGAGTATAKAGQQAQVSAGAWAQLALAFKDSLKEAEAQIQVASRLVDAKKIEGQARVEIARLSGDEAEAIKVAADAAKQEQGAIEQLARARQREVEILSQQRDRLQEVIAVKGDESGARRKEVDELNNLIATKEAEATKTQEAAEAARGETLARELAAKTYRDNSAALGELRSAYESAQQALQATEIAERNGVATRDQLRAATERAAQAEALYRDALADSAKNTDLKVRKAQTALSVTEAQIAVQRQVLENEITEAERLGNTSLALDRKIRLKELDVQVSEAKIKSIQAEVAALKAQIAAEEAALDSNDPLLAQKRAEIELRRQNIQIKELEIQKILEVKNAQQSEIETMRQRGSTSSSTADQYVRDRQREASANDATRESVERLSAAEAERKRRGVDAKGFASDTTGQTVSATGATYTSIFNRLKSQGVPEDQARSIAAEFANGPNGSVPFFNNAAQLKYGGPNSTLDFAVDRAAEQFLRNGPVVNQMIGSANPGLFGGGSSGQIIAPVTPSASGAAPRTAYTVNINLGGQSTTINTASQADAENLTNMLRQIGDAANRSA